MVEQYFPVPLKRIVIDTVPNFDLYIKQTDRFVLYRKANLRFEKHVLNNLIDNRIESLYVAKHELKQYEQYREQVRSVQESTAKEKGFSGIYTDPAEVDRYPSSNPDWYCPSRFITTKKTTYMWRRTSRANRKGRGN